VNKVRAGEAPVPAREARALPRPSVATASDVDADSITLCELRVSR